jgi:hypothetical protein
MEIEMIIRHCVVCEQHFTVKFNSSTVMTCSKTCAVTKRQQTNVQKYGHVSNLHGSLKSQIQENLVKKYGVTNISQIPAVKAKKQETCLKNFGTNWPMQSSIVKNKSAQTLLSKYGVDNISKVPNIIMKIQNILHTPSAQHNGQTPFEVGVVKLKQQNLEKYGVEYYFQSQDFRTKYKEVMTDKYGADNIRKSDYFNQLMIEKGLRYRPGDRADRDEYYAAVNKYTKRSLNLYGDLITQDLIADENIIYNVDHIYSISQGFKNKIPAEIVGHIVNLQMLPERINKSKGDDCWIDSHLLLERYERFQSNTTICTPPDVLK